MDEMLGILKSTHLERFAKNFENERITPDVVSKLSLHEFEALGVTDRAAVMKLREASST